MRLYTGGSVSKALLTVYPQMEPQTEIASPIRREEQKLLDAIKALFINSPVKLDIIHNARKKANLPNNTHSGKTIYLELDVWIPQLNIGFEYQVKYIHFSKINILLSRPCYKVITV